MIQDAAYIQNPLFLADSELNTFLTILSSFGIRISYVWSWLGLIAVSMAAQYATHSQPSRNINNLSFFALKRELLSFYPFIDRNGG